MPENRYNLIDEDWIPIANRGKKSLRAIFNESDLPSLGGNPVEKISLMKLLLAIAQASYTPKDNADWKSLGSEGMAKSCLEYLDKWHDVFYLYGEKPFLQKPEVVGAKSVSYGAVKPEIADGNTTQFSQISIIKEFDESQKALLLLTLMSFALGGKKTDNSFLLTKGYTGKMNDKGKPSSGSDGVALAKYGLLHSFYTGNTLQESIYYNLFTLQNIQSQKNFINGLGVPPWEKMPQGEDCAIAQNLKNSFQGRLIPLARFCLLAEESLHYTEGIKHLNYLDGMTDPTVAGKFTEKTPKMIWVNPEKRPWRSLSSLLSFLDISKQSVTCLQLEAPMQRLKQIKPENIGIWSGGLSVSSNAGEQYVAGNNDYVDSSIFIPMQFMDSIAYAHFEAEMKLLEEISSMLYTCVTRYYSKLNLDKNQAKEFANKATLTFWNLAERKSQELIDICSDNSDILTLRKDFASYIQKAFQSVCPADTARQLQAFVQTKPNLLKYLKPQE